MVIKFQQVVHNIPKVCIQVNSLLGNKGVYYTLKQFMVYYTRIFKSRTPPLTKLPNFEYVADSVKWGCFLAVFITSSTDFSFLPRITPHTPTTFISESATTNQGRKLCVRVSWFEQIGSLWGNFTENWELFNAVKRKTRYTHQTTELSPSN